MEKAASADQRIMLPAKYRGCTVNGNNSQVHHAATDWKHGSTTHWTHHPTSHDAAAPTPTTTGERLLPRDDEKD
ncbi:hypothetical protein MHEL_16210 [Mycolicibacterium helvum]|uniref:Uncharacterized protein n=1 Tax=Mycolicibacterium helvum TaxID=1534349 RepID=A0A7I7T2T7_9MYCO|nr:hypothetical protein MHEL_16210 [Mycolicibacterium helvum]